MLDTLTAVQLESIAVWVVAIGILIIGIAMAFAGIEIGKRAIAIIDSDYQIKAEDRPENLDQDDWDQNYAEGFERDQERYRN